MTRASSEPQPNDSGRFESWARFAVPVGIGLVLLPLLVSAISTLVTTAPTPIRDQALMEMRVRDVGIHAVNLGLYSRDGWSHIGPLVFFTLALPYRIFGSSTAGMVVGALLVNAASAVAMVTIARRLGGRRAALVMLLLVSVLVRAMGTNLVANPWVLFISILPFGVFCCVVWAMLAGRIWALPVGAALASWLVQTHVGYVPLTAPLLVGGSVVLAVTSWRRAEPGTRVRFGQTAALTLGVLVILWALPVWDQIHGTGNLARAARWFTDAKEGVHTLAEGARVVLAQFAVVPDWMTGTRRVSAFNGETLLRTRSLWPILLLPFAVAMYGAWRRRSWRVVTLGVVVLASVGLGIVAVARTIGVMYEYRMLWTWVVGGLAGVVMVWTAWDAVAARVRRADAWIVPSVVVVLAVLASVEVVQVATAARADWDSPSTASVVRQLSRTLDPRGGQILLTSRSASGEWYLQGVLLGLAKGGYPARVRDVGGGLYPPDLTLRPGRVQARLEVVAGFEVGTLTRAQLARRLAYGGPLPLRRELAAVRAREVRVKRLFADLDAHRISGAEFLARVKTLPQNLDTGVVVLRSGIT